MTLPRRPRLAALLAAGVGLLAAASLRDWLFSGIHRFYVDQRLNDATAAAARQRFAVEDGLVQPQIVAVADERLVFPVPRWTAQELRLRATGTRRALVEVAGLAEDDGARVVLARGEVASGAVEVVAPLPSWVRRLELSNQGPVTWRDPRVVSRPVLWPWLLGLGTVWLVVRLGNAAPARRPPSRVLLAGLTAAGTTGLCAAVLEVGLR